MRHVDLTPPDEPGPRSPFQQVWLRADGALPDDPVLHACVVTYASDMTLLDTAVRPHGRVWGDEGLMMASLDHAMWFHRPFRADDWLLYDQDTPSSSGEPRPGARQHLHAGRAPRGHRRAGGPDPGAPRMRRLAGLRGGRRAARRLHRRRTGHRHHHLVDHGHDGTWRHHQLHRSAAGTHARLDRARDPGDRRGRRAHRAGRAARLARPVHRREGRAGPPHRGRGGRVRRRRGRAHLRAPDHAAARHLRPGDQRGRARPARDGVLERRPQGVPRLHPPARRAHRGRRVHARRRQADRRGQPPRGAVRRAALRQPQRRPPRHRTRRLPLRLARRRRRRRRPARPRPGHLHAARLHPAHRPRGRHRGRARLRHPAGQPLRRR